MSGSALRHRASSIDPVALAIIGGWGAQALMLVLAVVSGALLARLLGPSGRGTFAVAVAWFGFTSIVADLGMNQSLTYHTSASELPRASLWGEALVITLLQSCIALPVAWAISHATVPAGAGPATTIGLLFVPLSLVVGYQLSLLRGLEGFAVYNGLRVLQSVMWTVIVCVFYFMRIADPGLLMLALGLCIIPPLILAAIRLHRLIGRPSLEPAGARRLLGWGLRVYPTNLAAQANIHLDRLIMASLVAASALGQYVAAAMIASALAVIPSGITTVTLPIVAKAPDKDKRATLIRQLRVGLVLLAAAALLLIAVSPLIVPLLFGEAFRAAIPLTQILALGAIALGCTTILHDGLRGMGRLRHPAIVESAGLVVTVGLLLLLVPVWGVTAAAWISTGVYWLVLLGLLLSLPRAPRPAEEEHRNP